MSTTVTILLLGACCVGVLALVGTVVNSPDPSEPRRPRGYRPVHRGGNDRDVERPLPPARQLEEQLVSFPVGHPEQAQPVRRGEPIETLVSAMVEWAAGPKERTEEQALVEETPVVHHGADEDWSPKDELPATAPLDPERTEVRRAAGRHRRLARTVSPDRIADRHLAAAQSTLDETLAPLLKRLERAGHADTDTWEWSAEEYAAIRARAGAQ